MSGGGCQYPLTLPARVRDGVQAHAGSGRAVMFDGGCAAAPPLPTYLLSGRAYCVSIGSVMTGSMKTTEWD
jgi:hypothetical protein